MTEKDNEKRVLKNAPRINQRLFQNRVAGAWVGDSQVWQGSNLLLKNARPIKSGFGPGSSDLIGWTTVTITEEMVGRKMAVFTAVEVKRPAQPGKPKGKPSDKQMNFLRVVNDSGGIGSLAYSPEDVNHSVNAFTQD